MDVIVGTDVEEDAVVTSVTGAGWKTTLTGGSHLSVGKEIEKENGRKGEGCGAC
jgi:hypothetical protein